MRARLQACAYLFISKSMDALEKKKQKARRRWNVTMITLIVLFVLIAVPMQKEGSNFVYYTFIALFVVYFLGRVVVENRIAKWHNCPKCNEPEGIIIESIIIEEATLQEAGKGVHRFSCKKCGHEWEEEYEIPCLVQSSSDDDDDDSSSGGSGSSHSSGSWGGGSTSGGGAGGSF